MKILLLSSTSNVRNGYGNITYELCAYLAKRHDILVLLPESERVNGPAPYPVKYILPPYIFDMKTPKILKYLAFAFPEAKKFDLIHSLFEFPYALLGARLAKKYHKPLIIGTQGTYAIQPLFWHPERWALRWAYNAAHTITAPSAFTRDAIVQYAHPRAPIRILHNGVNFERFQQGTDVGGIRGHWPGKKLLLTVGGLKPRKGQDVVIRALGILAKSRDDFQYVIVGGGKLRVALEQLAQQQGVADRVSFMGEVVGEDLVAYFQACDVYVHTPVLVNWQFEGFGIVYLEASACRKPIIAADSGGIRDAVIDGKTGLIVPELDVAATARAIERLLDDPILAASLGEQGYAYAQDHSWDRIGAQFMNLYGEVSKE
jgi:phosphatidylinositol alpha-1,6-mannosyltransferase